MLTPAAGTTPLQWYCSPHGQRGHGLCQGLDRPPRLRECSLAGRYRIRVCRVAGPVPPIRSPGSTARRRRVPRSGMRSTVEAGGASPDNARRSGPLAATSSRLLARRARGRRRGGGAGGRGSGIRRGPQAAGHRGVPCAAARRAVGLASEGRGEKLPPRNGETPGEPRPPTAGHPGRFSPRLLAPVLAVRGRGRQARRAEGAPLKPYRKLSQLSRALTGAAG